MTLQVARAAEESQEWEGDLLFTVRSQRLLEPDFVGEVSLKHALRVELLKEAAKERNL